MLFNGMPSIPLFVGFYVTALYPLKKSYWLFPDLVYPLIKDSSSFLLLRMNSLVIVPLIKKFCMSFLLSSTLLNYRFCFALSMLNSLPITGKVA